MRCCSHDKRAPDTHCGLGEGLEEPNKVWASIQGRGPEHALRGSLQGHSRSDHAPRNTVQKNRERGFLLPTDSLRSISIVPSTASTIVNTQVTEVISNGPAASHPAKRGPPCHDITTASIQSRRGLKANKEVRITLMPESGLIYSHKNKNKSKENGSRENGA